MTAEARAQIVQYLERQLMGPAGGEAEEIRDPPHLRYTTGVLFPRDVPQDLVLREETDDDTVGGVKDDPVDDPVALANQWMPSSAGLSFYVEGADGISCEVFGARYEPVQETRGKHWRRVPIATAEKPEVVELRWTQSQAPAELVLQGRARVLARARPLADGFLVTVTLLNEQNQDRDRAIEPEKCLLQVGLACTPLGGTIMEYPRTDALSSDPEDAELRLLYRDSRVFAIGHGCAAQWSAEDGVARRVRIAFIPRYEVAPLVPVESNAEVLSIARLADTSIPVDVLTRQLRDFVDGYEEWARRLPAANDDIPQALHGARDRLLARVANAVERMHQGIDLLAGDPVALQAFRLANEAMLMQMHHSKTVAAEARNATDAPFKAIDYLRLTDRRWYPFQLAFMLMTLRSLSDASDAYRDTVDLIWFPTGGGKTEAYLGLAAYEIFLRRLRDGDLGAGTTVITRYTLRLLTTQQFQRAATLACACELLRQRENGKLGSVPITIGLWVGGDASPNWFIRAKERLDQIQDGTSTDSFLQVDRCPWCGTRLIPEDRDDVASYGAIATATSFRIFCPSAGCPFNDRLPISVIDEEMYGTPPTILVGTVDKFAQLAWSDRGGAFFGLGRHSPPSLVIQDELHLIAGPLGTTVGIYEAAIQGLLELAGARPKIVASTATIRRSRDQVRAVFGREVSLFPPAGLRAADSYFAREDAAHPGRLFVGVMSQSHTPSTSLIHLSAALAQAPVERGLTGGELDAYWTQVIYHNSLRELGKTVTYARDDIPARVAVIARDEARMRDLGDDAVVELTGNVPSAAIPGILSRLFARHDQPDAISILLATNMIQVGIDVPRLGLMVVNGQPKTTSEYIQATSRIGRADAVGLVVTMYSASKPRDRSHYESFVPYHSALYRHVEPSSLTPFSVPSRRRALHAALVILARHGAGLPSNDDAGRFDGRSASVIRIRQHLLNWVDRVDQSELEATEAHLDRLINDWARIAEEQRRAASPLFYQAGKQYRRILKRFYEPGEGWETLDSMRSVDRECFLDVIGGRAGDA
ncbi:MAG TPA: helicase-related protein [Methylococcus sp.]|nr:helicase-related protein [Methylococcus sp.]